MASEIELKGPPRQLLNELDRDSLLQGTLTSYIVWGDMYLYRRSGEWGHRPLQFTDYSIQHGKMKALVRRTHTSPAIESEQGDGHGVRRRLTIVYLISVGRWMVPPLPKSWSGVYFSRLPVIAWWFFMWPITDSNIQSFVPLERKAYFVCTCELWENDRKIV